MLVDFMQIFINTLSMSDMDDKKKDDKKDKSTKFLVPFSPNTPRPVRNSSSSVFLTPPCTGDGQHVDSIEKAIRIPCFPRDTAKIPFNLSFEKEDIDQDYKFDILKALDQCRLLQTVIKKVILYLDDLSLIRASHVSKTWRTLICGVNGVEKERFANFISKKRQYCENQGKENIGTQKRQRNAAQSILECTPKSPAKIFKQETNSDSMKYRPCPRCNSPAQIDRKDSASCEICNEKFCLKCFKTLVGHNLQACTRTTHATPKKRSKSRLQIIGSKQSKIRLQRLISK